MADQRLTPQEQVDRVMAELRARTDQIRQAHSAALTSTGEATSNDGTVRATVDSTGVLTKLDLSPLVFERTTPDKLARTIVATAQSAARTARGRSGEAWQSMRSQDNGILATAARESGRWGLPAGELPEVPNTATDPTGDRDPWERGRAQGASTEPAPGEDEFALDGRNW